MLITQEVERKVHNIETERKLGCWIKIDCSKKAGNRKVAGALPL